MFSDKNVVGKGEMIEERMEPLLWVSWWMLRVCTSLRGMHHLCSKCPSSTLAHPVNCLWPMPTFNPFSQPLGNIYIIPRLYVQCRSFCSHGICKVGHTGHDWRVRVKKSTFKSFSKLQEWSRKQRESSAQDPHSQIKPQHILHIEK